VLAAPRARPQPGRVPASVCAGPEQYSTVQYSTVFLPIPFLHREELMRAAYIVTNWACSTTYTVHLLVYSYIYNLHIVQGSYKDAVPDTCSVVSWYRRAAGVPGHSSKWGPHGLEGCALVRRC